MNSISTILKNWYRCNWFLQKIKPSCGTVVSSECILSSSGYNQLTKIGNTTYITCSSEKWKPGDLVEFTSYWHRNRSKYEKSPRWKKYAKDIKLSE